MYMSVQMKIIDPIDISNIKQLRKKILLKISPTAGRLFTPDTLATLDVSDDELEENCSLVGKYKKVSYTQVRDSINHLYYDSCSFKLPAMKASAKK